MYSDKEIKMHKFYMGIAKDASNLSYAVRSKVGSVLVKDNNIISFSWNGTPSGFDNVCEDSNNITLPIVSHSEINAITKCASQGISTKDATLYVTHSPCFDCSKAIINAKIKCVIYLEEYRIHESIDFLKHAGVTVLKFSDII